MYPIFCQQHTLLQDRKSGCEGACDLLQAPDDTEYMFKLVPHHTARQKDKPRPQRGQGELPGPAAYPKVPVAEEDEHSGDQVIADDLTGNVAKHERAEAKTGIKKTATLRKEIEAVHFERPQESSGYANEQQKGSDGDENETSVFVI